MENLFPFLQQTYNKMLAGAPLANDSHDWAVFLTPSVSSGRLQTETSESSSNTCSSSQDCSAADSMAPSDAPDVSENMSCCLGRHPREIMLLQLTLIKMMFARLQSRAIEIGIKQEYRDIIGILLKEANIESKLICLLRSSDKLLSHMASRSLASLVHFQLKEEGSLNSTWLAFCSETLSRFPSSGQTAGCLWTLTNIVREILKDEDLCKGDELRKLFIPLDSVLEAFYNCILSHPDVPQGTSASAKATNDLSSFLDLLELLVASRSRTPLSFVCQRMLFWNASRVLDLATSPVHDVIKKKSILLLKRCILYKAGEDLIKGRAPPSTLPDLDFNEDRLALADAVLQFVNSGWLNGLCVSEKASHFGGSQIRPDVTLCSSPDHVILRAISLVLLKALEIKIQDATSEADAQVHLESVMRPLLMFLKNHPGSPPHIHSFEHPCTWLSVLFIEQDDDMLEAAKALLIVHLKFERFRREVSFASPWSDDGTRGTLTHQNGCNPHCVFLFLLKSVTFDINVLLDFLISSETCFLEYFVRYLKLLVEDWHHFVNISKLFDPAPSRGPSFPLVSLSGHKNNACQSDSSLQSPASDPPHWSAALSASSQNCLLPWPVDKRALKPDRSDSLKVSDKEASVGALQKLVDYESSEDSEVEWVGEECLSDTKQTSLNNQACTDVAVCMDAGSPTEASEQNALPSDQEGSNTSSPSHCKVSPDRPGSAEGMLEKSVKCFQELQESISRLHRKNLFPYNPAALLKLLTRVSREHRSSPR